MKAELDRFRKLEHMDWIEIAEETKRMRAKYLLEKAEHFVDSVKNQVFLQLQ